MWTLRDRTREFDKFTVLPRVLALNDYFLDPAYLISAFHTIQINPGEKHQDMHHGEQARGTSSLYSFMRNRKLTPGTARRCVYSPAPSTTTARNGYHPWYGHALNVSRNGGIIDTQAFSV
jgi:hypothetical protein